MPPSLFFSGAHVIVRIGPLAKLPLPPNVFPFIDSVSSGLVNRVPSKCEDVRAMKYPGDILETNRIRVQASPTTAPGGI
jgi:hypothetical protein